MTQIDLDSYEAEMDVIGELYHRQQKDNLGLLHSLWHCSTSLAHLNILLTYYLFLLVWGKIKPRLPGWCVRLTCLLCCSTGDIIIKYRVICLPKIVKREDVLSQHTYISGEASQSSPYKLNIYNYQNSSHANDATEKSNLFSEIM